MTDEQFLNASTDAGVTVLDLAEMVNERELVIEFSKQLVQFVDDVQPAKLLLNFANVRFFSSEAINGVLQANLHIKSQGGRMVLCGMSKDLRRLFKLLALDRTVLEIHESKEEATAALLKADAQNNDFH